MPSETPIQTAFTNKSRPTVFYREDKPHSFRIGKSAYCYPINHPKISRVTGNGETPANTSPVVAISHLTGEFWTSNTHYAPLMP
jgi:hypothetical protein